MHQGDLYAVQLHLLDFQFLGFDIQHGEILVDADHQSQDKDQEEAGEHIRKGNPVAAAIPLLNQPARRANSPHLGALRHLVGGLGGLVERLGHVRKRLLHAGELLQVSRGAAAALCHGGL